MIVTLLNFSIEKMLSFIPPTDGVFISRTIKLMNLFLSESLKLILYTLGMLTFHTVTTWLRLTVSRLATTDIYHF